VGRYSIKGSAEFDARIDADMKRIAEAVQTSDFSEHWKALVLLGGYGRGEGSPLITSNGSEQPFNDYDLIVVTNRLNPKIRNELRVLEKRLTDEIGLPVDLYPYLEKRLPTCEFSLLNYEMKYGHRVIWGNKQILDAMPNYPHNAIPLSEGTRLLMNRGKLLLDTKLRLAQPEPLNEEERQRLLKFMFKADLAYGDCALLATENYDISYSVKKTRIGEIKLPNGTTRAYLDAITFKEWTDFRSLEGINLQQRFQETVARFEQMLLWFESRRLNKPFQNPKEYADLFPGLGNEGSSLKNALHNLQAFHTKALPHLFVHPRLRLYATIPLLLQDPPNCTDAAQLLASPGKDFEACCKTFYTLQQRFS
jgi:predicted nucleotidyltransferase